MILTELKTIVYGKHTRIMGKQEVTCKCDNCETAFKTLYRYIEKCRLKYGSDLCRSCRLKRQYDDGKRVSCFGEYNRTKFAGTWEERYGVEKANEIKLKMSNATAGEHNPMFGKYTEGQRSALSKVNNDRKGKTIDEIYGKEKAINIKKRLSDRFSGQNNPMFGKPSPERSGHGIGGRFNNLYFRSLLELAWLVNHQDDDVKNAESLFSIPYEFENTHRTYHPDFLIGNCIFEIKAKWQIDSEQNKRKFFAARDFCEKNNYIFKIISEDDILPLSKTKIMELMENGVLSFNDPSRIK